ncbi:MAG: TIGR03668 family PPOX class F420-dependent oxidoreductase [Actinobacteria bacterium]|nr:MAG: TIGR03668 family PPOX class F420-dependent oxidoreductase [Actinomycetota bacterium]
MNADIDVFASAALSPVARLATVGASGEIDLVPITFALSGSSLVTAVDHKPKRSRRLRRLDNIARDPRVTVLVDHYDDDWSKLWWARLRGRAFVVSHGPRFDGAIAQLVAKYPQHYGSQPPQGPVIAIDITEVRTWRAS